MHGDASEVYLKTKCKCMKKLTSIKKGTWLFSQFAKHKPLYFTMHGQSFLNKNYFLIFTVDADFFVFQNPDVRTLLLFIE